MSQILGHEHASVTLAFALSSVDVPVSATGIHFYQVPRRFSGIKGKL
jgi:hypothetical protein